MAESEVSDREQEKRERFIRIAEKRTTVVLQKLRVLGNCANRASYSYTASDIEKIRLAIGQQLERTIAKFESQNDPKFRF